VLWKDLSGKELSGDLRTPRQSQVVQVGNQAVESKTDVIDSRDVGYRVPFI
jgi:hypothetical protein